MKWEHKIGIAITCTFLCLVGAVLGLKMQEQPPAESPKVAVADPAGSAPPTSETKHPLSFDNLDMPSPGSRSHAEPENASGDAPRRVSPPDKDTMRSVAEDFSTRGMGAKENAPSGKKATQSVKDGVPTPSVETRNTATVSAAPLPPGEPKPTLPPVRGAGEWDKYSSGSGGNKQSATPAAPKSDTKTVFPTPPSSPETKKQQPVNPLASPMIVPTGGIELPVNQSDAQAKPSLVSPSPTIPTSPSPGTGPTPTPLTPVPLALGSATNSASPSVVPAMPKAPPTPASPPTPSVNPVIVSPTPAPPILPPTTTSPPPVTPMPVPIVDPSPTATPAPVPAAAPLSPPKPPTDGSSFIPDRTSSASGPAGVKPAPLPFPVPPPSSPLASAPDKPAPPPPQPASNGPSVTVYDEQDYSCKSGDTWEGISKRFYMTDRYAKALARHNQNHARASNRIRDTGQLALGERIFVPQAYVLEERYADAIPRPAAAPASMTTPATFVSPGGAQPPPQPPAPQPQP